MIKSVPRSAKNGDGKSKHIEKRCNEAGDVLKESPQKPIKGTIAMAIRRGENMEVLQREVQ
jgi:hypothetical protein